MNRFLKVFNCFALVTLAQNSIAQQELSDENSTSSNGLTITADGVTQVIETASKQTAYICTLNGLQRRIDITLNNPPAPVPCSVNYTKSSEDPGNIATLWTAQNDPDYCEAQAKQFVEKLQTMQWQCSQQ